MEDVPGLVDPVVIAAFEGWNDAADAASSVVDHLMEVWSARVVGTIDPDEFYDFQVNRPYVGNDSTGYRRIQWPGTQIAVASPPDLDRGLLVQQHHAPCGCSLPEPVQEPLEVAVLELDRVDLAHVRRQQVGERLVHAACIAREDEHRAEIERARAGGAVLVDEAQDALVQPLGHDRLVACMASPLVRRTMGAHARGIMGQP